MKLIIKILQDIIVILATIVVNQNGEFVPDRSEVIYDLLQMYSKLEGMKNETI